MLEVCPPAGLVEQTFVYHPEDVRSPDRLRVFVFMVELIPVHFRLFLHVKVCMSVNDTCSHLHNDAQSRTEPAWLSVDTVSHKLTVPNVSVRAS
jgi:hypothetical protein